MGEMKQQDKDFLQAAFVVLLLIVLIFVATIKLEEQEKKINEMNRTIESIWSEIYEAGK
jgi:preprotein translocase subunit YajC